MEINDYKTRLEDDLNEHKTVLIVCKCSIEYWGRSRSIIGLGDRLIIIKPDTTLIIHSPTGFKPVNWMSAPTDTSISEDDNKLLIFSQRTKSPYEEMRITIEKIIDYTAYLGLRDSEKLDLIHTEKDMKDYLVEHLHHIHPDFKLKSIEYRSPLGFFDLYGKIDGVPTVVELKADKAGLPAALQIKRYKEWLESHVKKEVRAILVSPSITPNTLSLLKKDRIEHKKFNIKKIQRKSGQGNTLEKWMDEEKED